MDKLQVILKSSLDQEDQPLQDLLPEMLHEADRAAGLAGRRDPQQAIGEEQSSVGPAPPGRLSPAQAQLRALSDAAAKIFGSQLVIVQKA